VENLTIRVGSGAVHQGLPPWNRGGEIFASWRTGSLRTQFEFFKRGFLWPNVRPTLCGSMAHPRTTPYKSVPPQPVSESPAFAESHTGQAPSEDICGREGKRKAATAESGSRGDRVWETPAVQGAEPGASGGAKPLKLGTTRGDLPGSVEPRVVNKSLGLPWGFA
jgi:hypothetical protein